MKQKTLSWAWKRIVYSTMYVLFALAITGAAEALCPPAAVVYQFTRCGCNGGQEPMTVAVCQGSGSGCDPLRGNLIYCVGSNNCFVQNAAACTPGTLKQKLTASLSDGPNFQSTTSPTCPAAQRFRLWLSEKSSSKLDR